MMWAHVSFFLPPFLPWAILVFSLLRLSQNTPSLSKGAGLLPSLRLIVHGR